MARRTPSEDDRLQVPVSQELVSDMRRLYPSAGPVPAEVDEAILAAARARIAARRRAWIVLRRVSIAATAAAAAIGLAVWIGQGGLRSTPTAEMNIAALTPADHVAHADPKDIDRNGHIDILDAFMLARHIEKKRDRFVFQEPGGDRDEQRMPQKTNLSRFSGEWDFNGDGVVDQGDVDGVAMAAVSLKGGAS